MGLQAKVIWGWRRVGGVVDWEGEVVQKCLLGGKLHDGCRYGFSSWSKLTKLCKTGSILFCGLAVGSVCGLCK